MKFCPFCDMLLDYADRCSFVGCFMWFTLVPIPDVREPTYVVQNACGEVVFVG